MKRLEQTYIIDAPLAKVWQALTDPAVITQWGGAPVIMSGEEGSEFSLWDGDIVGTNTKVVPEKLLEQDWTSHQDGMDRPSKVVFSLSEKDGKTTVKLTQSEIPDDALEDLDEGWKVYYLGPIKELLET